MGKVWFNDFFLYRNHCFLYDCEDMALFKRTDPLAQIIISDPNILEIWWGGFQTLAIWKKLLYEISNVYEIKMHKFIGSDPM